MRKLCEHYEIEQPVLNVYQRQAIQVRRDLSIFTTQKSGRSASHKDFSPSPNKAVLCTISESMLSRWLNVR